MFGKKQRTAPQQNDRPKPTQRASGTSRVKASLLLLESRLMFDAAATATAAEVNQQQVAQEQAESAVTAKGGGEPTAVENESQELLQAITTYSPGESRTEMVFVDPTVPNYQELLSGMDPNIAVIMLDGGQDGVEQMASALAGRTGIDAIHLISHGGSGELQLGTGTLTTESMSGQYAEELDIIQQALSGQADILVYGCDFAEGQAGQEAATLLSQLTGADVAASTDATGFAALGGDWVLETQIGTIETQIAVDDGIQANWVGLLAAPVVDLNAGGVGNNVTTAFTEQTSVLIAPVGMLSDVDSPNLNLLTVTLTARPDGNAVESLSLNAAAATVASGAGLTVSYTASTGVLLITGTASTATYETILQGILYNDTSDQPTTSNRSITVVARDSTNASSTSRTATITVTAVNDASTITGLSGDSRAYSEGAGAVVIESGNAVVADVDSTNFDTGTLTVSIPAGGDSAEDVLSIRHQGTGAGQIGVSGSTVTYQGVTIGAFTGGSSGSNLVITLNSSATPTAVTALVRNITYQNTDTNAPTTGARTVRFVLTDGDGGTSPNYDTTVTVSGVNDAPVLADTALSLTVVEDAGVPSGAVGSLISTFTGGITDVDSGASKGIAITGSNQTNGIWYYTTNGGSTWTVVGTVSNTSALLLADNGNTRLYFAPNANYNGTSSAALTVRAWDQTSGTAGTKVSTASNGGTTAFSSATDTVDVTVTAVNDASTDLSTGMELNMDGGNDAYLISDTGLSQSLTATTVEIRFAANDLPLETVLLSFNNPAGDELSIQLDDPSNNLELDFGAGTVAYASAINYRGALVDGAVHTLSVTWDSIAGNWSVFIDGSFIESGTGLNVGTPLDTTNGQFVFGQEQDGQNSGYDSTQYFSGTFHDVRIWNDVRTAGEIAQYYQQQLDVTPAEAAAVGLVANWQMDGLDGSNQVVDLVSGNNLSIAHASGTGFTTGAVNVQLAIEENSANGSHVGFVTTEDSDAGETFSYSLTDSAGGRFAVNSVTGEITVANGTLLDFETAISHSITVRVTDSGGLTYDETLTINLTNMNEMPTGADATITISEDTSHTFTTVNFGFSDVDAGDSLSAVRIDTLPSAGSLTLSGVSVTAGQFVTVADITAGNLVFTPVANANGTGYASVTFSVRDSNNAYDAVPNTLTVTVTAVNDPTIITGGTSGTGNEDTTITNTLTATDVEGLSDGTVFTVNTNATNGTASIDPATGLWSYTPNADYNGADSFTVTITDDAGTSTTQVITLSVTAVNDAPLLVTNTSSTVAEGGTDTIDASELAVTDVDNTAAQLTYSIGTGPLYGRLELTTAPGLNATTFTQADIAANRLVYLHNGSETTSDSFTFTVNDGAGGSIGTTTVTLTITPVNDTPTITSNGGGATAFISVAENVSAVTIVTGADVDLPAQALTYSLSGGADQARFTINSTTGVLNFTAPPDFEVATDANGDNVYVVQVQVTDSQGASTTQTIQVTVADVVEGVLPTPTPPPVLLPTTPPSPTGPGPAPSRPLGPAEPPTDALPQAPVLPDSGSAPAESHPATVLPSPTERLVVIRPEEPRATIDEAKDSVLFPWIDEARRLLLTGLLGEPTPTPESEPAEKSQSVSDLLFSKLNEMTASLEQAMGLSQEQHVITVRIAALTGTTLSAGFIAWALRSGTLLASFMATMPAWRHFDPLPVLGGSRREWERRRKEAEQDQQAENTEFKGLKHLLDLGIPPDPKS